MDKNMIRQRNRELIQRTLFQHKRMFASDLVKETGISMVTINSLLKELMESGNIYEGELVQRDIGRPAIEYHFNDNYSHALLLAILEKNGQLILKAECVDLDGTVLAKDEFGFNHKSLNDFLDLLSALLNNHPNVERIGLLFPGKVHEGIIQSGYGVVFDGWPIVEAVKMVTDLPFYVQNDAHLVTIGHCIQNKIPFDETIVGIYYPNTSMPGVTIFTNGQLLEGHLSLAGEAKYLPFLIDAKPPQSTDEHIERLTQLIGIYNVTIAPHRFVLSSNYWEIGKVVDQLNNHPDISRQPNRTDFEFVTDYEAAMSLGLRWLIYQDTPFHLSV